MIGWICSSFFYSFGADTDIKVVGVFFVVVVFNFDFFQKDQERNDLLFSSSSKGIIT